MARKSGNLILVLVLLQIMFGLLQAVEEGWERISEEENLQMENQLKVINKTPIKSFKTEYGDILDCIEIYKQHAFDHPLLKDHKVQMRPKNILKSIMEGESPSILSKNIECPPGTVMIKRTTKEDLIMAKKMKALGSNLPTSSHFHPKRAPVELKGSASAHAYYAKHNFGAKTTISVWNPSTASDQSGWSNLWITNGPPDKLNVVQAGWGVYPTLFSSNYTRLIAHWTADNYVKTGCMNYLCPGFVQVHRSITLGLVLDQISVYNGTQREIEICIFSDGEWWLKFYNQIIGYWPQKLFYYMYGGANYIRWGGKVTSPSNKPSPSMGSGHFPKDGLLNKSAYFKDTQIWDSVNFIYPESDKVITIQSRPDCYGAEMVAGTGFDAWYLFYGGPGQCNI